MRGPAILAAVLFAAAFTGVAVGIWPAAAPPSVERVDLRGQLLERRRRQDAGVAVEPASASRVAALPALDVVQLCDAHVDGRLSALDLGPLGEALLLPCGTGAQLWAARAGSLERLAMLVWPSASLRLGHASAADVNGDGHADLLFVLRQGAPGHGQAHRQGLYWARGRLEGGFEAPEVLVAEDVQNLLVEPAGAGAPAALWVVVDARMPAGGVELWRLSGGPSPARTGRWALLCKSVVGLTPSRPADGKPAPGPLILCTDSLWQKPPNDDAPLEPLLAIDDARRFVPAASGGLPAVLTASGWSALQQASDGLWELGESEGPRSAHAAVQLNSGRRFALARAALWTWYPGESPIHLGTVGGVQLQGLTAAFGASWLWLSGLLGAQSSGVVRISEPWEVMGPVRLRPQRIAGGVWPAQLTVP